MTLSDVEHVNDNDDHVGPLLVITANEILKIGVVLVVARCQMGHP
jgi:hypothetical protein